MMTEQKQFAACAELDGLKLKDSTSVPAWDAVWYGGVPQTWHRGNKEVELPDYSTYDAMIPLIVKWCNQDSLRWSEFYFHLPNKEVFQLSPEQLRHALLRAAGRWEEGE